MEKIKILKGNKVKAFIRFFTMEDQPGFLIEMQYKVIEKCSDENILYKTDENILEFLEFFAADFAIHQSALYKTGMVIDKKCKLPNRHIYFPCFPFIRDVSPATPEEIFDFVDEVIKDYDSMEFNIKEGLDFYNKFIKEEPVELNLTYKLDNLSELYDLPFRNNISVYKYRGEYICVTNHLLNEYLDEVKITLNPYFFEHSTLILDDIAKLYNK